MSTVITLFSVIIGLLVVIGGGFWVMTLLAQDGGFRNQAPNLNECPKCGERLDHRLDHCPKCQLRTSV